MGARAVILLAMLVLVACGESDDRVDRVLAELEGERFELRAFAQENREILAATGEDLRFCFADEDDPIESTRRLSWTLGNDLDEADIDVIDEAIRSVYCRASR